MCGNLRICRGVVSFSVCFKQRFVFFVFFEKEFNIIGVG